MRKPSARKVSKTERWLNLLAFLLDRRYPVTREQILSEVEDYKGEWLKNTPTGKESVRRKFERDKRELRELGIVIEPERKKVTADHTGVEVEAYLLRPRDLYLPYLELASGPRKGDRSYYLPNLTLKPEEFTVLRRAAERVLALGPTPLGASAASALRKLSFDLPGVASADDEVSLAQPVAPGFEKIFATLREGVERKQATRCRYYSIGRDEESDRVIEPYGLMLSWGYWYCIARARDRDAVRVFRLDRMRAAALLDDKDAHFEVAAGFSVRNYLDRAPWELSEAPSVVVRVRIKFPHSRWTIAEGLGRVVEAVDAEGGAVLEFGVRIPETFIRWLLPFGTQAEILEPAELAARLADERRRVRALYR
jgi:predicted DNA-binding transcriptional regulator YafY